MKKNSFIVYGMFLLAVISLTLPSCSRKVGCYYSQMTDVKERLAAGTFTKLSAIFK